MGRHSAPDDDESVVEAVDESLSSSTTATLPVVLPDDASAAARGRHSMLDDGGVPNGTSVATIEAPAAAKVTDVLAPIEPAPSVAEPAGKPAKPGREKKPKQAKPAKPSKENKPKEPKPAKAPKPPKQPKAAKEKKPPKQSGTRADLRLLRENGAVRARCIGAVLLAFLAYTIVMVVLGKADSYLLWLWVPIVVSGVLVGSVLDLAYRAKSREEARAATNAPSS